MAAQMAAQMADKMVDQMAGCWEKLVLRMAGKRAVLTAGHWDWWAPLTADWRGRWGCQLALQKVLRKRERSPGKTRGRWCREHPLAPERPPWRLHAVLLGLSPSDPGPRL